MQLPLQSFTTLMQNMAASVQGTATALIDLTVGSVLRAILEANASVALWVQWLIVQVLAQTRAATSNGADLDSWVADFGVVRLPASPATTTLTFSRITTGISASIPVGAQAKTADATQVFTVTTDATNPAYSPTTTSYIIAASVSTVSVPAVAAAAGSAGNVQAGLITLLATAIAGVDAVSNPVAAAGGLDAESDAALRARFANFIDSRSRATPAAIAYTIQSLQQGLDYTLVENQDPSGATRPGFFTVTIDDGSGAPPNTLLTAVYEALDNVRPVGTQLAVRPPQMTIANIAMSLSYDQADPATAQSLVSNAISSYVSTLPIGVSLPIARLIAIAYSASPAVTNVTNVSINGGGDLTVGQHGIIRPGTVTVS